MNVGSWDRGSGKPGLGVSLGLLMYKEGSVGLTSSSDAVCMLSIVALVDVCGDP